MAFDKFLIAPYKTGLKTNLPSWLLPEDAFTVMENALVFRGRVKKRFGSDLTGSAASNIYFESLNSKTKIPLSRLTVAGGAKVGITNGAGDANGTLPTMVFRIGQRFTIGTEIFTVIALGTPAVMTTTGGATTHTLDTTTGAYVFAGAAATTQIYFYQDGNALSIETDGAGDASGIVPGTIFKVGQQFSIGTEVFTVPATGAMLTTGAGVGTFNTTTGAFIFTGCALTSQIYFYPNEPIMAITYYEKGPINEHTAYVMDTQFIYKFVTNSWIKDTSFSGLFHGGNNKFFWSANWEGATPDAIALFTTNFNATVGTPGTTDDPIYYYNNTGWYNFSTLTKFNSDQDYVSSSKIIINFKNRLLLINTIENDISSPTNNSHTNRIRWSHNGSPFPSGVTGGHPWLEPNTTYVDGAVTYIADGAGYLDAPIEEEIVSAALIRDRLIIFFERSTMELCYSGNNDQPFFWRTINNEFGSESTFSTVISEGVIYTIGTTGVYACNGMSVARIDENIPDEIFSLLKSSSGTKRVHGVKDYFNELIYWTILDNEVSSLDTFPNKVLVYNYKNGTWSFNDDCITTFGYFEQSTDKTWADPGDWDTEESWDSFYKQAQSRQVLAGNHHGYLFTINNDKPSNAAVLPIANFTYTGGIATLVIPNHNLLDGDYIKLVNSTITYDMDDIFRIIRVDANSIQITDPSFAGTYLGGATIAKVSEIFMQSADWNPYISKHANVYLAQIDFCVVHTAYGQATINYNISSTTGVNFIDEATITNTLLGTNVLETSAYLIPTIEQYQDVFWHRVNFQAQGESVSIQIYFDDYQMLNSNISETPFEIQGMILFTQAVNN